MKSFKILLLLPFCVFTGLNLKASIVDSLSANSKIKGVTVFFDGAQITRQFSENLSSGKTHINIDHLPVDLHPKSIQVESVEGLKILSVKHEVMNINQKTELEKEYETKIETLNIERHKVKNQLAVFQIEEKMLLENSNFSQKDAGTSVAEIQKAADFYRTKLNEIRDEQLKLSLKLIDLEDEIKAQYNELNQKASKNKRDFSRISFFVEATKSIAANFKIKYFVQSAGWRPTYDFRVQNTDKPLNLVYNAEIFQSSTEDWKNVQLTLSTSTPSLNNKKPELKDWYINRRNYYQKEQLVQGPSTIKGTVVDKESGEPLPFVNVAVYQNDKLISGAATDFDGNYIIKPIKPGNYTVETSFVGYKTTKLHNVKMLANNITTHDIQMATNIQELAEVVIREYNEPLIAKDNAYSAIKINSTEIQRLPSKRFNNKGSRTDKTQGKLYIVDGYQVTNNATSLEYKIDVPYSIPSDGNDYNVKIQEVIVPTAYAYHIVPKVETDAFLVATIIDWEQLNLLSGNASIYYSGTFTGNTSVDSKSTKDSLQISLNRERDIIVERKLVKEKNTKQFAGNNIKETFQWSITLRNTKGSPVDVILEDQLPITQNKAVEIDLITSSEATLEPKSQKLTWDFSLAPNERKEIVFSYMVKYPNTMSVVID